MIVKSYYLKCKARQIFSMANTFLRYCTLILSIILFLNGCKVQLNYPSEIPSKSTITFEENFWFWGLIGEKNYEVYDICPEGRVFEIRINTTMMQSVLTAISIGIFSPRTTTIVCSIRGE